MRHSGKIARHSRNSGMTLIEVMIALLLFSSSFLGLVGMQTYAVQTSVDSENRTRAALLANEITATMLLYNTLTPSVAAWQARVKDETISGLPMGKGDVSPADTDGTVTVTITWRPTSRSASAQESRYFTKVALP